MGRSGPTEDKERAWPKLERGGRLLIPPHLSQAVGLEEGDDVQLRREAGEIRLIPGKVVMRCVQKTVA